MTVNQEKEIRPKPAATNIEQALISSIIINRNAIEKVSEFLKPVHFFDPFLAEVYQLCCTLYKNSKDINPLILKEYIGANRLPEDKKKCENLIDELALNETSMVNTVDYGKQILDRYIRRELIDFGYDVVNDAYTVNIDTDATDYVEKAEDRLYKISVDSISEGGFVSFAGSLAESIDTFQKAWRNKGKLPGVATRFTDLDKVTGGLHDTDLIILAGRPAMGKTALATCMAFNAAKDFYEDNKNAKNKSELKSVAFFSLEMSAAQLASRIISAQAQINGTDLRNGTLNQSDFNKIQEVTEWMQSFPLFIDDTAGMTVNAIRTRAKRLKRSKDGLGLIIIDYLQLIESDNGSKNQENRVQEVSKITRELKKLAKDLKVPVVVLSQLNRGVESRDEKIPQLADLRESGSIEQDADIVMAVYREWYYLPKEVTKRPGENDEKFNARVADLEHRREELKNIGEVIILKNRHGETKNIKLFFDGPHCNFTDLAR